MRDLEAMVAERMRRQEIFTREDPPVMWALLWVEVPVGGKPVMRAQLAHLLEVSEATNIAIRVVPKSVGAQPGMDGAFQIMSIEIGDVTYVNAPGGGRLVSSTTEVRLYGITYDRIGQQAMAEGPSRDLIKSAMEAMR